MPICKKNKIIFVHIPRTGGTSILKFLNIERKKENLYGGYCHYSLMLKQHYPLHKIKIYLNQSDNYFKFSIVRNPYSRIISIYNFMRELNSNKGRTFNSFLDLVEEIYRTNNFSEHIYYQSLRNQWEFILEKPDDEIDLDVLFKYEKFKSTELYLQLKFNKDNPLLHFNHIKNYINLTTFQKYRIYKLYKKDFELFNYSPDLDINIDLDLIYTLENLK
jgi:hypothetical protein